MGDLPIPDLTNPQTALSAAGFATNFLPKGATPVQLGLDYLQNEYAMADTAVNAAKGIGQIEATAVVDSPAYKHFIAEMYDRQPTDTMIRSVVSIAGALLGGLLLAALPIPFTGIIGAILGGIGGNFLAEQFIDSKHFDYQSFANGLETESQQRTLTGEQTFVALVLNLDNKAEIKALLNSYGFKKKADFVEALDTNPELITQMMHDNDALIREAYHIKQMNPPMMNLQTGFPVTASEMLAMHYNSNEAVDSVTGLKGANLLSSEHVADSVLALNKHLIHIEQARLQQASVQPNPGDLPNLKSQQRSV